MGTPKVAEEVLAGALEAHKEGRLEEAVAVYREILTTQPDHADTLHLLGVALHQMGQNDEARPLIERATKFQPNVPHYHNHLGQVLFGLKLFEQAEQEFEKALALRLGYPQAYNNLGLTQLEMRRYEDASFTFKKALVYDPDFAQAHNNLGRALLRLGNIEGAVDAFKASIQRDDGDPDACNNLGVALRLLGRFDEAEVSFEQALKLAPAHMDAHVNKAHSLLTEGDLAEGWAEHEWRLRRSDMARGFGQPLWEGDDIKGKTILLWAEQGLGDTLQFLRYAPLVAARGANVIVECHPLLRRLAAGVDGVVEVVEYDATCDFDLHLPLLSLPRIFETELSTIPARVPYLPVPDPMPLEASGDTKVGLVWAGNPNHANDRNRSRPLQEFAPLAAVEKASYFALQKGTAGEQPAPAGMALTQLGPQLDDFYDTAAALAALDLLISVDTSVAHLAGALGRPVWLMLPYAADWRWLRKRDDSPWYPTMRLFRQDQDSSWQTVFEVIAGELAKFVARAARKAKM
jgi:Flp pilus assembly protein TadD